MDNYQLKIQQQQQLRSQLILTATKPTIQADVVLKRLVQRALRQLQRYGDAKATADQVARELGYYLFCHQYQMPRAAYDLLVVAQAMYTPLTAPPLIRLSE
ncbi:hypothetical protein [Lactiplantibacillus daowaiensis]|uniref:Bacteriocin immunity protein n=1 Tax=Lactiplantibacillus daowaiensis TaxID=2559918 RepID=A0ABW1S2T8_9LACO|nr:hypothetical protein [Lactiplantibacillus daowaiensis]